MQSVSLQAINKQDPQIQGQALDEFENDSDLHGNRRKYDPKDDQRDMEALADIWKRRFRFFSTVGYVIVLGLTWEYTLITTVFSLANGGTAGAIWLTLIVCVGMSMVTLSFAEMASMAPTSGGQYHWVSEFAPPRYQKQLSYTVGWLAAIGWQVLMAGVAFVGAQQTQALIVVCNPNHVITGWHSALLSIAFMVCAILFNTLAIGKITILEGLAIVLHFFGFVAFIVILWVMGPRAGPDTFSQFTDENDWGNLGLATLVSIVGPMTTYLGSDSAVHLAEELEDASYILPRAMCLAAIVNYILGFSMTITFMFNLGSLKDDLASATGQPWVAVIQRITRSRAASIILTVLMIIMFFFCAVNVLTTSSRQVFAFARDKGIPFHRFFSQVRSNGVPTNSVFLTLTVTILLSLILIGSTAAFNIILSVGTTGLFTSYIVVIGTMLAKRLRRGERFPASKFDLGTFGIPINIGAICFLVVAFAFLFFPAAPDPSLADMNWAIVIYGAAILFAFSWYLAKGRHEYEGPVTYVRKDM
ncbi:hypothetical protein LTR37_021446 [Vermiconidia calcicola]|uniref:Uncharacterized protein n=1 Tax=Vermiconidia calcicola TaxID=1690605 RepID=A0ACC3MAF5_9PEZI|nr:hypothetical protein LTR37_021446 [Vermiconidia calcicola]